MQTAQRAVRNAALLLVSLFAAFGLISTAPAAEPQPPGNIETLKQSKPTFLVRADVDRGTRTYRDGDRLSIRVSSEEDAYLYVLYRQADGKVFQVFPNSAQGESRLAARQAVEIPGKDDLFRWTVGPPFGKETIKVIASKQRIADLDNPAMREKWFNPVSPQQVKGVELELGAESPPPWAEDQVEIVTYARDAKMETPGARRVGVFIGVRDYEFDDLFREVTKAELTMPPCHRDANRLAALMREAGRLNDLRIYTNEQATRKQIEEAIAKWLPSASRPGDTVFIFFSGGVLPAANAHDGKPGAVLLPHDYMPLAIVPALVKQYKEKGVAKSVAETLKTVAPLLERAGTMEQKSSVMARTTGVGNDLFAHWLQALAGRQVVVILDTPSAAAFAPAGAATKGADAIATDALTANFSRLKGLGQQEVAVLGACGTPQAAVVRVEDDLSLLTHCLVRMLATAPGPVQLDEAHVAVGKTMEQLFDEVNKKRRAEGKDAVPAYQPYLLNTCTRPVVLKP